MIPYHFQFLHKFTDQIQEGKHLYPEMQDPVIHLIGVSGYLTFFEASGNPESSRVGETLRYLRILSQQRVGAITMPMKLRRHAWRSLSAMAVVHVYGPTALPEGGDSTHLFCVDDEPSADAIALGFIGILDLWEQRAGKGKIRADIWRRMSQLPEEFIMTAFKMMLQIKEEEEEEFTRDIQNRLIHYQVESRIRSLTLVLKGTASAVAGVLLECGEATLSSSTPL